MVFCVTQHHFGGRNTSGQTCSFRVESLLNPKTSSSSDVTDGLYNILKFRDIYSCFQWFPLFCLLLCGGMWRKPLPAWDPVTLLAASPASQASAERGRREEPLLSSRNSAECTFNQTSYSTGLNDLVLDRPSSFYCKAVTWKPDQVSVLMFNVTSEPLAAASGILSCKATDHLSLASELKSSVHQLQNSTMKPFQLNDRNPLFTVRFYTHLWATFPRVKRKQKLKQEQEKQPWILVSIAFKRTTASRRWRV